MFYHSFAGIYDIITQILSLGLWKTWLAIPATYLEGPTILELGSGPGHLQILFTERGTKAFGLDESQQMVEITRSRLNKNGHTPALIRAVGEALPFGDSTFNQVVTTFPAEFITDQATLADVYRILKDNGKLVILRFSWLSNKHWPHKMTTWLFRLVGEAPDPNQPIQVERLSSPFTTAGFSVEIVQIELEKSGILLLFCTKYGSKMPRLTVLRQKDVK